MANDFSDRSIPFFCLKLQNNSIVAAASTYVREEDVKHILNFASIFWDYFFSLDCKPARASNFHGSNYPITCLNFLVT